MNNQNLQEYTASGALVVSVFTASGALPVSNALVTIRSSEKEDSGVFSVLVTDQSGNTPKIVLPTPPSSESESPGNKKPYATYTIEVDKEGYYPRQYINVPIFANTTSIQPVNLVPSSEYGGESLPPIDSNITEGQNPNL